MNGWEVRRGLHAIGGTDEVLGDGRGGLHQCQWIGAEPGEGSYPQGGSPAEKCEAGCGPRDHWGVQ